MLKKRIVIALVSVLALLVTATPAQAHSRRSGPSRSRAPGQINGHPCGGDLPPCYVLYRESKGQNIKNKRSSAAGYWQMLRSTASTAARGIGRPDLANRSVLTWTPEEQDDAARWLWDDGDGCSHWRACRR